MRVLFLESHPMWLYGLPNGFRDAGHEVKVSGPIGPGITLKLVEDFQPQLIIMLGWTQEHIGVNRKWIRDCVKKAGAPFVYWATEDPIHARVFTIPFIQSVRPDFVFTVSAKMVPHYEKIGFLSAHMDFGHHRSVHKSGEKVEQYSCSIAVVANAYPALRGVYRGLYRFESLQTLIKPVLKAGFQIDFWGWQWKEMSNLLGCSIPEECLHGYLPYTEAYKVYNSADIVLGLQNTHNQVTMRTYEILASGGFLITSDTPAVRQLFEPGRHLAVSKSPVETVELVRYYLENTDERKQICQQALEAVSHHSYRHRAEYMEMVLQERELLKND